MSRRITRVNLLALRELLGARVGWPRDRVELDDRTRELALCAVEVLLDAPLVILDSPPTVGPSLVALVAAENFVNEHASELEPTLRTTIAFALGVLSAQRIAAGERLPAREPLAPGRLTYFRTVAGRKLACSESGAVVEALPELIDEIDRLRRVADGLAAELGEAETRKQ